MTHSDYLAGPLAAGAARRASDSAPLGPGGDRLFESAPVRRPSSRPPKNLPRPLKTSRMVLDSPSMAKTMAFVERLGPSSMTVTVFGETGTGKDVVARLIHERSARSSAPFVIFDCGAVAPNLVESELFGHEKGSFTGAVSSYQGAFERAHGGTLFLDEIGELPLELQPRLLRALDNRQIRRVGGGETRQVDVRVVAATNRDLAEEVRAKRFREDLYFRLTGAAVVLPSLRSRKEDLPALAESLLHDLDAPPEVRVTPEALTVLAEHDWPGNVRELKNVLSCALCMASGDAILAEHIQIHHASPSVAPGPGVTAPDLNRLNLAGFSLTDIEQAAIAQTLKRFGGQKTKAAEVLGIALSTLYEKIKRYGIG